MKNFALWAALLLCSSVQSQECIPFIRGDVNEDGSVNASDIIAMQGCLDNGVCPARMDAVDWNDDGVVDPQDVSEGWNWVYMQTPAPASPYPGYGQDTTEDVLDPCCGPLDEDIWHIGLAAGWNTSCGPGTSAWPIGLAIPTTALQEVGSTVWSWSRQDDCSSPVETCNYGDSDIGVSSATFTKEGLDHENYALWFDLRWDWSLSADSPCPNTSASTNLLYFQSLGTDNVEITIERLSDGKEWIASFEVNTGIHGYQYTAGNGTIDTVQLIGDGKQGSGGAVVIISEIIQAAFYGDPPEDCDPLQVTNIRLYSPKFVHYVGTAGDKDVSSDESGAWDFNTVELIITNLQ